MNININCIIVYDEGLYILLIENKILFVSNLLY